MQAGGQDREVWIPNIVKVQFLAEDSVHEYLKTTGEAGASLEEIRNNAARVRTWKDSLIRGVLERLVVANHVRRKYKVGDAGKTLKKRLVPSVLAFLANNTESRQAEYADEEDILEEFEDADEDEEVYDLLKDMVRKSLIVVKYVWVKPKAATAPNAAYDPSGHDGEEAEGDVWDEDEYDGQEA